MWIHCFDMPRSSHSSQLQTSAISMVLSTCLKMQNEWALITQFSSSLTAVANARPGLTRLECEARKVRCCVVTWWCSDLKMLVLLIGMLIGKLRVRRRVYRWGNCFSWRIDWIGIEVERLPVMDEVEVFCVLDFVIYGPIQVFCEKRTYFDFISSIIMT